MKNKLFKIVDWLWYKLAAYEVIDDRRTGRLYKRTPSPMGYCAVCKRETDADLYGGYCKVCKRYAWSVLIPLEDRSIKPLNQDT